jgi:hypothetical protein
MDDAKRRGALAEMLDGIEMPPHEIAALAARARDAAYWTALAPGLTIGHPPPAASLSPGEQADAAAEQLRRDRYFTTAPVVARDELATLNAAVDAVVAAGWPPVFALIYDCVWAAARHPAVSAIAAARLGQGYRQIPHVWVHLVPARAGARGWMPHFDGFRPRRLTVWIALTDATVNNGCIHLIPPDSLPDSFRTMDLDATVVMRDVVRAMHATRALPAAAGSLLGWDFDVFHWGGSAPAPQAERRSISLVFLAAEEASMPDELPLIDLAGPLPDVAARLRVIAMALDAYGSREASLRRFRALSPHLIA